MDTDTSGNNLIPLETLRAILVTRGYLTADQFDSVLKETHYTRNSFIDSAINAGLISDENLGRAIADYYGVHFVDLRSIIPPPESLTYIPEAVARAHEVVATEWNSTRITIATALTNPTQLESILFKKTGKDIVAHYATSRSVRRALKWYKGDLRAKIVSLIATRTSQDTESDIVTLIDLLIEYAVDSRASDIHIEPLDHDILIRYRIDGILHEILRYPATLHERIVSRIKILSHLQTDEQGAAQDGRFEFSMRDGSVDVRVSILPVTDGENVVMRLLDPHADRYLLENIGLSASDYKKIRTAIEKPHGMILAVGPTGCGKTTVLYTLLEKLNSESVNIMTIEDPVEYDIEGVQQTQVNVKKQLTFATGLRSIVRQDPDIIMVGEIRDEETADIAVNSALTGHLVLSTLHTNDAATTFPRLTEMNVEPFLIASSVQMVIALRLVRRICTHCRQSYLLTCEDYEALHLSEEMQQHMHALQLVSTESGFHVYRGIGCTACHHTGFVGRVGIFEILEINDSIRKHIVERASADIIEAEARALGMRSLLEDGVSKVFNGLTTIEEVLKAAYA